jgi:hypothetical protein
MPKCLECDNVEVFNVLEAIWNRHTYNEHGEVTDTRYLMSDGVTQVECARCMTTRVEGQV